MLEYTPPDDGFLYYEDPPMQELALIIGHLIIEFNTLETKFSDLLDILKPSAPVRRDISFSDKLRRLRAMMNNWPHSQHSLLQMQELVSAADQLNASRNVQAHSEFFLEIDQGNISNYWSGKIEERSISRSDIRDLHRMAHEIVRLQAKSVTVLDHL